MVYCQECGSEIAEVDIFCPFCGITIKPVEVAGSNDLNDSEDSDGEILTTGDVGDSDAAVGDANSINDKDEDISMSETIVGNRSVLEEKPDKKDDDDSGYLDVSSLKADSDKKDLNDKIDVESGPSDARLTEAEESKGEFSNSIFEAEKRASPYLNVSENQDDIDEPLGDEDDDEKIAEEESTVEKLEEEVVLQTDENTLNDDESVLEEMEKKSDTVSPAEELTETKTPDFDFVEPETAADTQDDSKAFAKSKESDSNVNLETENEVAETFGSTKLTDDTESKLDLLVDDVSEASNAETLEEIHGADDTEIDEALSVIDSKALVWRNDENKSKVAGADLEEITSESDKSNEIGEESIPEVPISFDNTEPKAEAAEIETELKDQSSFTENQRIDVQNEANSVENEGDGDVASLDKSVVEKVETPIKKEENPATLEEDSKIDEDLLKDVASADSTLTEVSNPNESVAGDEAVSSESKEVPVSLTTPNIGVNDTDGNKSSKLKPLDEGVVLNSRYEIVRKIGGGGMGAVYLANDKNLGGVLRAVKEMVQSYIEEEQQVKAIKDFKRESMLLTSLEHPSIPTIYDYFYDEKEARFYLVMKYISGGDLAARLRAAPEGKLDEVSVTNWAYQIADVLEYLHSREPVIVYRDLKPANIMIDGNTDKVMLIDFGIARCINKEEKGVTAVGTMGYAPPELFSGNVQPSSDIYSLGSTMFHLLTGADPQSNPLLIFDFQKHPMPRQINPQLSDQMERILMRAVEYNAEKRFRSAAEMRDTLKEHLENLKAGSISYGIKETPASVALADQPVFCGFCGQKIVATDMFCAFCGAKQPLAQPGVQSKEYNNLQQTARLVIEGTNELDYPAFELVKNDNLVGRRDPMSNIFPEVDLSKFDPQTKISRKHARIWRNGDSFMVEDLGSSNGTIWISSISQKTRLVPNQSQMLKNGDKIQVGDTTLEFIKG